MEKKNRSPCHSYSKRRCGISETAALLSSTYVYLPLVTKMLVVAAVVYVRWALIHDPVVCLQPPCCTAKVWFLCYRLLFLFWNKLDVDISRVVFTMHGCWIRRLHVVTENSGCSFKAAYLLALFYYCCYLYIKIKK